MERGHNLHIDVHWNAGDIGLSRIFAAELIGLMPDVILAGSTINLAAIQQATAVPSIASSTVFAKDGGLMDYSPYAGVAEQYRQAAHYVGGPWGEGELVSSMVGLRALETFHLAIKAST